MKSNTTKSLLAELNKTARLFKNNLFEDYGMEPQGEEYMGDGAEIPQGDEMAMEQEPQYNEQTVDTINQIRQLAIQGIAQYANDVESEQYKALKRIWLETDKFYETINGDKDKK